MKKQSPARIEVIGLSYSAWTERVCFTLDHHGLPYRFTEHVILVGMPELLWKMRRLSSDLTVPAMVYADSQQTFRLVDSFKICQFLDEKAEGGASKLFFKEEWLDFESVQADAERAAEAARVLVMPRILSSPEAQAAMLPGFIPNFARGALRPLARFGAHYIASAFGFDGSKVDEALEEKTLREVFTKFQDRINQLPQNAPIDYRLIAIATSFQGVDPVSDVYLPMKSAVRECWRRAEIARQFQALGEWRDDFYARFREKRKASG